VSDPLLEVSNLCKVFNFAGGPRSSERQLRALDGVSFTLKRGETLGVVGESGSGKSTLARCLLRLIEPSAGSVSFDGLDLLALPGSELRRFRRRMQIVFQDATGALDPRMTVGDLIEEPLLAHGIGNAAERRRRVEALLARISLGPDVARRRPHAFSGGQRQRIGIARALAPNPEFIILDEPVSALDMSIQAQVLNLLKDLQQELALTYLFIVHDLSVAEFFCDRILVLYLGEVMETGPSSALFRGPQHPYTASLVSAIPAGHRRERRKRLVLQGEITPIGANRPEGCVFRSRCPVGRDRAVCAEIRPRLQSVANGVEVACHFPGSLSA